MAAETNKIKAKLANLDSSLSDLESSLEPILSQSLPESIIGLEVIQQAKLQTLLPYLVYDLVFIYLKAKGVDPKTHSVISELDRVRQYFEKITKAENPPTRRSEVDKDAAGRFIKHAIAGVVSKPNASPSGDTSPSTSVPVKVTPKMIARAQYERTLGQSRGKSEDDELQVYDEHDSESPANDGGDGNRTTDVAAKERPISSSFSKRRRPAVDPFAGYGDDTSTPESLPSNKKNRRYSTGSDSVVGSPPKSKKKKKAKKSS
ncbi:hypothetical protein D9756_005859 [Leucocoprinus leucothites]|uniref:Exosome complex protein n=1 Tax=Leucocoprinus leucothites TaxID=201217 RepID=A0A8H5FWV5_9AGAR|nr:hypothetical protein D9756_005859 [Leucoagaricus leucothites]